MSGVIAHGRRGWNGRVDKILAGRFDIAPGGGRLAPVAGDPTDTDPDKYKVVFENERVRVLEYRDRPGDRTSPHRHPDSVMYTLSSFERRLVHGDQERDVQLEAGRATWLGAQEHSGENIGTTGTHVLFVELKEPPPGSSVGGAALGPAGSS
jgi:hypothetical protein